jgi:hypothetical protein
MKIDTKSTVNSVVTLFFFSTGASRPGMLSKWCSRKLDNPNARTPTTCAVWCGEVYLWWHMKAYTEAPKSVGKALHGRIGTREREHAELNSRTWNRTR